MSAIQGEQQEATASSQNEEPGEFDVFKMKVEKTPEDLAAIALLDKLRCGEGESMPVGLPLACVVKVVEIEDVPKANDRYAMVTVSGPGGRRWRMCISRYYLDRDMDALFVSREAALPMESRYQSEEVGRVKVKAFRFGFGIKEYRYLPIVRRGIYLHNNGLLYPLDAFPEVSGLPSGTDCTAQLHIDRLTDLKALVSMPGKRKMLFVQPVRPVK